MKKLLFVIICLLELFLFGAEGCNVCNVRVDEKFEKQFERFELIYSQVIDSGMPYKDTDFKIFVLKDKIENIEYKIIWQYNYDNQSMILLDKK